ncbi:MAG: hypothetical protein CEE38_05760 [Planctomycetes bacterium B3_Pla]|nr:MAG: hypothetical protein CEE38_05760 [Planctomycetes bacterium B3_Pla]
MTVEEHPYRDQIIRRASSSDICALVDICREAFPQHLRWQGMRSVARRWWEVAIMSSAAEAWIIQDKDEVVALFLLVSDEIQWSQEKAHRRGPFVLCLISAMCCFVLAGSKALRAMMDHINSHHAQRLTLRDPKPGTRTWIELIAVRTERRGQGFAKCLLRHIETRAKALGKKAICLRTHKCNQVACCLYETMGYQEASVNNGHVIYSKSIS